MPYSHQTGYVYVLSTRLSAAWQLRRVHLLEPIRCRQEGEGEHSPHWSHDATEPDLPEYEPHPESTGKYGARCTSCTWDIIMGKEVSPVWHNVSLRAVLGRCVMGGGSRWRGWGGHVLNPHYATSLLCPVLKKLSLFGTF